jgi:4-amino-4-deoxy-L-arabinose transferase-like glycosyltransferase
MKLTRATRDLAGLITTALITRVWWVSSSAWTAGDAPEYLTLARNLALHHAFSMNDGLGTPILPTASRPPLYPIVIALLWRTDSPPILAVLGLQCVLGAATVALVYLIARERFSRAIAVTAGVVIALAPLTGFFTAVVLTETLFTFLVTLAIFFWGRQKSVLAGLAFGLAALTRPTVLPFIAVLLLLALLPRLRSQRRLYVTIFLAAILLPAAWTVRNAFVFHEFIPVSASGWGAQVLCGTLDTELVGIKVWTGSNWALLDVGTHPLLQVDGEPSTTERERVYLHRGLRRIADHPVHWLGVRAIQYSKLFLDSGDYALGSHNVPVRRAVAESRFGVLLVKSAFVVGNLFVFAMALLGFYAERKRTPSIVHMIAFPIFLLFVHLLTSTESRYILPMMPMVAIFFAVGWQRHMQNSWAAIRRTDTQVQPSPGLEPVLFRTRAK